MPTSQNQRQNANSINTAGIAAVGMKSDIALNFLSRWPTLNELHRAKTHTVRSFFYAHNSRSQSLIEKRLLQIGEAHNVTDDLALIEPLVLTSKCLVGQLRQSNPDLTKIGSEGEN